MDYRELELAGVDMKDLMMRLMNNERLVRMFIQKFTEEKTYAALVAAVETGDMLKAEQACHALKGVSGNLSIKKLFELSQEQLRLFRAKEYDEAIGMMDKVTGAYDTAIEHMNIWLKAQ